MEALGHEYKIEIWCLSINFLKNNLKAVLLRVGNKYPSIPLAQFAKMKETYESMELLLNKIK